MVYVYPFLKEAKIYLIPLFYCQFVLQDLAKVPQDISSLMTVSVANILCDTILGHRYDHNDQEFQNVLHNMDEWFKAFATTKMVLSDFVPITRPFLGQAAQEMKDLYNKLSTFLMGKVAEHQRIFNPDSEPRDFIECYLAKMAEEPDVFTLEELRYVLSDLFSASTDTTANTLKYAILYMVLNPDVQNKVHEEAVKVCATNVTFIILFEH